MSSADGVSLLKAYYQKRNPFSARQVFDNFELLMFYCGSFMQDCVYFSKELDCVAIASFEDGIMTCYDVFKNPPAISLDTVLSSLAGSDNKLCELGFTPKNTDGFKISKITSDDYLFVLKTKENMFKKSKMRLPALSHA